MLPLIVIIAVVIFYLWVVTVSWDKGHRLLAVVGFFFFPFAVVGALMSPEPGSKWERISHGKDCPMCAERVKDAALVCRYCGHEFNDEYEAA